MRISKIFFIKLTSNFRNKFAIANFIRGFLKSLRCAKFLNALLLIFLLSSCNSLINNQSQPTITQPPKIPRPAQLSPLVSQSIIPDSTFINSKIRVAAILPISGANKEIGTAVFNSIVLSLFENDKNDDIELVVFDSKNNAQDAKKAINSIVSQNIKIIIGPIFSNNVEAISDIVSKNNITALSISNNQDLANKKGIFLMGFLPEQQIEGLTSYAISNGNNNISIIVPDNQYGLKFSSIAKEMIRRKDGNLISNKFYLDSSKDLEKIVAETINSYLILPQSANKNSTNLQPQDKIYSNTILIPESGIALSKINNLIKKFNTSERPIQIIGSSNWDDISTLNDPNLIGGWFVSASPTKYRDFEKRYYNTYNKFPPRISSIGYDAILALLKVIESSNTKDISPADFINYQSSKNGFNGIDGLFRFLPNGLVQRNFAILQIGNGKFEILESPNTMFFKY